MRQSLYVLLFATLVIMLSPGLVLSGDSSEFKVSSFIPELFTDLEWTIGGKFNLSGSDSEQDTDVAPGFEQSDRDSWRSFNQQSMNFDTDAIYVYETVKRQFRLSLGFSGNWSHRGEDSRSDDTNLYDYRERSSVDERDRLDYSISTNVGASIRQYFGDEVFGEFAFSNNYSDVQRAYDDQYRFSMTVREVGDEIRVDQSIFDQDFSSSRRQNRASFNIALGLGHVYEGSYASTALHIIDRLEKEGLIQTSPSRSQMLDLAEIIYFYRMKHAVDDRIHRQNALNEIATFLEDERIARDLNSQALYAIQDIWDYYPGRLASASRNGIIRPAPRLFGFRVQAGLGYRATYEKQDRELDHIRFQLTEQYDPDDPSVIDTLYHNLDADRSSSSMSETDEKPYFEARGEYRYPINHLWQFDAFAMTQVRLETVEQEAGARRSRNDFHFFSSSFRLSRYFDSRTTVTAGLSSSLYFKEFDAEASPDDITYPDTRRVWETDLWISANIGVTYRLAIPTTLEIGARFSSRYESRPGYAYNQDSDDHDYSLSAGINHFIY